MNDFIFHSPTRIVFGKGAEQQTGALLKGQNCGRVLLHYGVQSALASGLLGRIRASLEAAGLSSVELGGVVPNPRLELVYEGVELARAQGVDAILAVGGGSVIDSAKAIALGAANPGDVWDFFISARAPQACLPVGCVPTIAAAGSEMSAASVITDERSGLKRTCRSEDSRPVFAVLNPELTMSLSAWHTACGCVDILTHVMERYFSLGGRRDLTDAVSAALMRTVMRHTRVLLVEPRNYRSRAEVMWAGALAQSGLIACGADGGDWATHLLEHELGGMFDVAHGAGLSALWGSWARHVYLERPDRFAKFAMDVMDLRPAATEADTGLSGIEALEHFFRSIGMPTSMRELGLEPTDAQIEEMTQKALFGGKTHLGTVKELLPQDIAAIFTAARM